MKPRQSSRLCLFNPRDCVYLCINGYLHIPDSGCTVALPIKTSKNLAQLTLYRGPGINGVTYGTACDCSLATVSVSYRSSTSASALTGTAAAAVAAGSNNVNNGATPANAAAGPNSNAGQGISAVNAGSIPGTIISSSNVGGSQIIVYAVPTLIVSVNVGVTVVAGQPVTTTQTVTVTDTTTQTTTVIPTGGASVSPVNTAQSPSSGGLFPNSSLPVTSPSSKVIPASPTSSSSITTLTSTPVFNLNPSIATATSTVDVTSLAIQTVISTYISTVSDGTTTVLTLSSTNFITSTLTSTLTATETSDQVFMSTTTSISITATLMKRQADPSLNLGGAGPLVISSACSQLVGQPTVSTTTGVETEVVPTSSTVSSTESDLATTTTISTSTEIDVTTSFVTDTTSVTTTTTTDVSTTTTSSVVISTGILVGQAGVSNSNFITSSIRLTTIPFSSSGRSYTIPSDGFITAARSFDTASRTGTLYFGIWRPAAGNTAQSDGNSYTLIYLSPALAFTGSNTLINYDIAAPVPVLAGNRLGLSIPTAFTSAIFYESNDNSDVLDEITGAQPPAVGSSQTSSGQFTFYRNNVEADLAIIP
ncbi:hypothetical protein MRB53_040421 [Persea americana]|nr:hypothetical protein MRB53_040421 [Persea americana]